MYQFVYVQFVVKYSTINFTIFVSTLLYTVSMLPSVLQLSILMGKKLKYKTKLEYGKAKF